MPGAVVHQCAACRAVLVDGACPVCGDRWSGTSEEVVLGPGWAPVANAASVEAELARELGPTHVLRGRRLHASLDDFVRDYHEEW